MIRKWCMCGLRARLIASLVRNGKPKQSIQLLVPARRQQPPTDRRAAGVGTLPGCVARVTRNARLLLLGHMPDHNVVMRHVHSGVTPIEIEGDVVDWSGERRRLQWLVIVDVFLSGPYTRSPLSDPCDRSTGRAPAAMYRV